MYAGQPWGELYDRSVDPRDTRNLWDDARHTADKAELSVALNQKLMALMDESPRATRNA